MTELIFSDADMPQVKHNNRNEYVDELAKEILDAKAAGAKAVIVEDRQGVKPRTFRSRCGYAVKRNFTEQEIEKSLRVSKVSDGKVLIEFLEV